MTGDDHIERWEKALDELEATLTGQRGFAAGGQWQPPFTPPPGLGPMPHLVADRARRLLDESTHVQDALRHATDEVRTRIEVTRRLRPGSSSAPASLVDVSG